MVIQGACLACACRAHSCLVCHREEALGRSAAASSSSLKRRKKKTLPPKILWVACLGLVQRKQRCVFTKCIYNTCVSAGLLAYFGMAAGWLTVLSLHTMFTFLAEANRYLMTLHPLSLLSWLRSYSVTNGSCSTGNQPHAIKSI